MHENKYITLFHHKDGVASTSHQSGNYLVFKSTRSKATVPTLCKFTED